MRAIFYVFVLAFSITSHAAGIIQGDTWKSSDKTKTWSPPSTSGTLSCVDCTETLENKTVVAPVIEDGIWLEVLGETPSSPPAGQMAVYPKDGKLWTLDENGIEREVGSGAGGSGSLHGILDNGGFEDPSPATGWTVGEGITCEPDGTVVYPDGGAQSIKCTLSGFTGTLIEQEKTVGATLNFENTIAVKTDQSGVEVCPTVDGSESGECLAVSNEGEWGKYVTSSVTVAGKEVGIRIKATGVTGTVYIDSAYLGENRNLGTVQEARWLGAVRTAKTSGCNWARTGAGADSWANFSVDSDCPAPTAYGSASAPATNIPAIKFASIPAGRLICTAKGSFQKTGSQTVPAEFRFHDGTTASSSQATYAEDKISISTEITGEWTYTTAQSNVTINIQGMTSNTSNTVSVNASVSDLEISCISVPASEQVTRVGQGADFLGTYVDSADDVCPAGSIKADGSAVSRTTYAALFNRIGTKYGVGDGSTTFNLPDAQALVLRGTGTRTVNGRTKTGPTNAGDVQEDAMQGHKHLLTAAETATTNTLTASNQIAFARNIGNDYSYGIDGGASALAATLGLSSVPTSDGSNGTPRTGSETRVAAMGVTRCIYYVSQPQPLIKQAAAYDTTVKADKSNGLTTFDYGTASLTPSNASNISGFSSLSARWTRFGDQVEVTLSFTLTASSASTFSWQSSLPVASDFASTTDASGVCIAQNHQGAARVGANIANNTFAFSGATTTTNPQDYSCKINYVVK